MNVLTLLLLVAIAFVLAQSSPFLAFLVIIVAVIGVIFTSSDSKSASGGGGHSSGGVTVAAPIYPSEIKINPKSSSTEQKIAEPIGNFINFVGGVIFKVAKAISRTDEKKEH